MVKVLIMVRSAQLSSRNLHGGKLDKRLGPDLAGHVRYPVRMGGESSLAGGYIRVP